MPRHVARNLQGEQLAVSYMLLPNSTTHALVTKIDALPMPIQRALISLIESPEAQRTEVLAEVLGRRTYADSGKNMLQVLHEINGLKKVAIDEIQMTPRANVQFPLRQVLESLGRIQSEQRVAQYEQAQQQAQQNGFNPHLHNRSAAVAEENVGIARNLIVEAEMLEADARSKRERAYGLAPQLDPRAAQRAAEAQRLMEQQAAAAAQAAALAEPVAPQETQLDLLSGIDFFGTTDPTNAPD